MSLSLLIIEDNRAIARQLCEFFEGIGWSIDYTETGKQGIELATKAPYDVILLDLGLPDIDGLDVCEQIKQKAPRIVPILMLTARDAFEDKAAGFHQGADDYVTKPFEFRELALRCEALSRRHQLHQDKVFRLGELAIDQSKRTVKRADIQLSLTTIGFDILWMLAQAYPNAVTRSDLIHHIWQDSPPDNDVLRTHIYSLRNQLDKPFASPMLKTLINVGYKLELPNEI